MHAMYLSKKYIANLLTLSLIGFSIGKIFLLK